MTKYRVQREKEGRDNLQMRTFRLPNSHTRSSSVTEGPITGYERETHSLLWWDYLEGGSKSMADCLDFDENFELGKI
jgi:hypothetical protein